MDSNATLLPTAIEAYVYYPLPDGCVRFVEVFSDSTNAPLRCRIFISYLNDRAPPYEALSYVWGPQQPLYDLQCSDVSARVLRIGPNLHNALLHLRFHPTINSNPRLLWIDRICINQDDTKERASQVLLMRSIYRRCRQALVWLGKEDQNTKDAFECARYIHENALGRRETPWKSLAQFRSPPVSFANLKDSLRSLAQLTYRPWFERAWTFQEVVLPSTVSLVCGNESLPLECLEACVGTVTCQASEILSRNAQLVFATRKIEDTFSEDSGRLPPDDLERLLSFRRQTKASDTRDIIFSLLGLFSHCVSLSLSPDYSISVKDLFTAVAIHIMRESGELRIPCSVESPKHLEGEGFPSWVPDWRASPRSYQNVLHDRNPRSGYQATRGSVLSYNPSPGVNELHLCGILIGAVSQAGKFDDPHSISKFNLADRYSQRINQSIQL
jgi:Heterokaryon incompatibility protein (HET)